MVIAIIALLVAILLPIIGKAKESSRQAACLSILKQVGAACILYATDHQGTLPKYYLDRTPPDGNAFGYAYLMPYMTSHKVTDSASYVSFARQYLVCPTAKTLYKKQQTGDMQGPTYAFTKEGSQLGPLWGRYESYQKGGFLILNTIPTPSRKILFGDALEHPSNPTGVKAGKARATLGNRGENIGFYHGNNIAQVVYMDGHAGKLRQDEFDYRKHYWVNTQ